MANIEGLRTVKDYSLKDKQLISGVEEFSIRLKETRT
jgi:hypothetical protein